GSFAIQPSAGGGAIWGLEFTTANGGDQPICINVYASPYKIINSNVHDCPDTGVGIWRAGLVSDIEVHGTTVRRNGTDNNLDHGIYAQNGGAGTIRGFKVTNSGTWRTDANRSVSIGYFYSNVQNQTAFLRNDVFTGSEALWTWL